MPSRNIFRLTAGSVMAAVLFGGCLVASGSPNNLGGHDFPDPAGVQISSSTAEVYSTSSQYAQPYNLPEGVWAIGSGVVSNVTDALPSLTGIANDKAGYEWAPTVSYIDGEYVMWIAAVQEINNQTRPACFNALFLHSRPAPGTTIRASVPIRSMVTTSLIRVSTTTPLTERGGYSSRTKGRRLVRKLLWDS